MKNIDNKLMTGILVSIFILTSIIYGKLLTIEEKVDNNIKVEQTQLDFDTSDFSELKKAVERLNCYDEFMKIINDESSKDPFYSTMLKAKLLQLILNESKTATDIELSICEEQQNEFNKLNDKMTNIVNQELNKNE